METGARGSDFPGFLGTRSECFSMTSISKRRSAIFVSSRRCHQSHSFGAAPALSFSMRFTIVALAGCACLSAGFQAGHIAPKAPVCPASKPVVMQQAVSDEAAAKRPLGWRSRTHQRGAPKR